MRQDILVREMDVNDVTANRGERKENTCCADPQINWDKSRKLMMINLSIEPQLNQLLLNTYKYEITIDLRTK